MNIREIIKVCWMAILFISCEKEYAYNPIQASVLHNGVLLSCVDSFDNDLLLNENFIEQIKIHGALSKKEIPFKVKKIERDNTERYYLSFNAELPDEKSMQFNGKNEAKGVSAINLSFGKYDLTLFFSFKYSVSNHKNYGGSIMIIEEIAYQEEKVKRQENHLLNSDFLFCIERNNDSFALKN